MIINIKYIYIIITILIQTITQLTLINNIDPTLVDYEIIDLIINKKKNRHIGSGPSKIYFSYKSKQMTIKSKNTN